MNQRGIALVTGLVLLAVMALLAVVAASGMAVQQRQVSNAEDRALAEANARLAEAQARAWLFSRADEERQLECIATCFLPHAVNRLGDLPANPEFESRAWWASNAEVTGMHPESGERFGGSGIGGTPPFWLIEEIYYEPADPVTTMASGVAYYRVFSRGEGRNRASVSVTETIVAKPWNGEYQPADFPPGPDGASFCQQFAGTHPCGILAWRQRR
jgi:Tfp pilus assembly protein PilX